MASEDDKDLENYKAELRRQEMHWRAQFEVTRQSDNAAVDIGLTALRTALLVNAGAVVALLAFVGQLWGKEGQRLAGVLDAILPFVGGLSAAALAAGVAYFYQSFVTAGAQRAQEEISRGAKDLRPQVWIPRLTNWTRIGMVGLVLLSYVFFLWGTFGAINAMVPA